MHARRLPTLFPLDILARLATVLALILWVASTARAGRIHPENILFGTIWAEGRPLTSTNLIIEARRGDAGPVVARYRFGEDPGAGELFFLRIQRESSPAVSPVTMDAHEPLCLSVSIEGRTAYRTRVQLPAPGRCLRIDFGKHDGEIVAVPAEPPPVPMPPQPAPNPSRKSTTPEPPRKAIISAALLPVVERRWFLG